MPTLGHQLADGDTAAFYRILAAATETQGNVSHMADMLGVSLRAVQYWGAAYDGIRDAVAAARDARVDLWAALRLVPRSSGLELYFEANTDEWVCRIGTIEHRAPGQVLAFIGAIRALQ